MAKYGHESGFSSSVPASRPQRPDPAAQVITVDSPSPKDKPTDRKGKRTTKRTPGRAFKSSKGLPTPSLPPKSQATKKRKRPTITVSESDESEELPDGALKTAPSKVYPSGLPKKKKNVSVPSPDRESDKTWSPTPPKKNRVTPKAKKPTQTKAPQKTHDSDSDDAVQKAAVQKASTGHKPDLNWCSSGLDDDGPLTHSKYTEEEKKNTAQEDA